MSDLSASSASQQHQHPCLRAQVFPRPRRGLLSRGGGTLLLVRVDTSWWGILTAARAAPSRRGWPAPVSRSRPLVARGLCALLLAVRGLRRGGALPLGCRFVRAGPVSGRVVDVISAARSKNKRAARRTSEVVTVLVRLWLGGWVCAPQSLSSGNTCVNLTSSQRGVGRVVLGGSTRSASRVGSRILATAISGGVWP